MRHSECGFSWFPDWNTCPPAITLLTSKIIGTWTRILSIYSLWIPSQKLYHLHDVQLKIKSSTSLTGGEMRPRKVCFLRDTACHLPATSLCVGAVNLCTRSHPILPCSSWSPNPATTSSLGPLSQYLYYQSCCRERFVNSWYSNTLVPDTNFGILGLEGSFPKQITQFFLEAWD